MSYDAEFLHEVIDKVIAEPTNTRERDYLIDAVLAPQRGWQAERERVAEKDRLIDILKGKIMRRDEAIARLTLRLEKIDE